MFASAPLTITQYSHCRTRKAASRCNSQVDLRFGVLGANNDIVAKLNSKPKA